MSVVTQESGPSVATDAVEVAISGSALLRTPRFNKGSAFSKAERDDFDLHGLLPASINSLDDQVKRAYAQFQSRKDPLSGNTFLTSLKDQNQVLYYRLIQEHLKEMLPIIYTPTEAEAITRFSGLFRRPEGCFLNISQPDSIESSLAKWGGAEDVDVIVCSDGEQILGIGDQGVGAIWISVAKLALYTLCAGIDPQRTLPVSLDVGTDNELLNTDPLYLGLRQSRVRGEPYNKFVDRFIHACRERFPKAYIHFEDFGLHNARRILDQYSTKLPCFNDDVQGTGCVALAALYAAASVAGTKLQDLRVIVFGAGSAGTGIADQICDAIAVDGKTTSAKAAHQIWCIDKEGLLLHGAGYDLLPAQRVYAKATAKWTGGRDLLSVIRTVKPHVLIGTSTVPKAFTKEIVQEMAKHTVRPIIFPLSNPTRLHEAEPKDLIEWTQGAVLTATGSPFPPVKIDGRMREIAECNNSVCFPGIGLGLVLSQVRLLTPKLLVAAVKALAAQSPVHQDFDAALLPDVNIVREVSVQIAAAVIGQAVADGLAQRSDIPEVGDQTSLMAWIRSQMWEAKYKSLKRASFPRGC